MEIFDFKPAICILDFNLTLTNVNTCSAEVRSKIGEDKSKVIADPEFLIALVEKMIDNDIIVAIVSFGDEKFIAEVLTDVYKKYGNGLTSPFRDEDTMDGSKNIFGNECVELNPCYDSNTIRNKSLKTCYAKKEFPCNLANKYNWSKINTALGKLILIMKVLEFYNLPHDAKILYYDDTKSHIDIFTQFEIRNVYNNVKAIKVSEKSHLTRQTFCQNSEISQSPFFKDLCLTTKTGTLNFPSSSPRTVLPETTDNYSYAPVKESNLPEETNVVNEAMSAQKVYKPQIQQADIPEKSIYQRKLTHPLLSPSRQNISDKTPEGPIKPSSSHLDINQEPISSPSRRSVLDEKSNLIERRQLSQSKTDLSRNLPEKQSMFPAEVSSPSIPTKYTVSKERAISSPTRQSIFGMKPTLTDKDERQRSPEFGQHPATVSEAIPNINSLDRSKRQESILSKTSEKLTESRQSRQSRPSRQSILNQDRNEGTKKSTGTLEKENITQDQARRKTVTFSPTMSDRITSKNLLSLETQSNNSNPLDQSKKSLSENPRQSMLKNTPSTLPRTTKSQSTKLNENNIENNNENLQPNSNNQEKISKSLSNKTINKVDDNIENNNSSDEENTKNVKKTKKKSTKSSPGRRRKKR